MNTNIWFLMLIPWEIAEKSFSEFHFALDWVGKFRWIDGRESGIYSMIILITKHARVINISINCEHNDDTILCNNRLDVSCSSTMLYIFIELINSNVIKSQNLFQAKGIFLQSFIRNFALFNLAYLHCYIRGLHTCWSDFLNAVHSERESHKSRPSMSFAQSALQD